MRAPRNPANEIAAESGIRSPPERRVWARKQAAGESLHAGSSGRRLTLCYPGNAPVFSAGAPEFIAPGASWAPGLTRECVGNARAGPPDKLYRWEGSEELDEERGAG